MKHRSYVTGSERMAKAYKMVYLANQSTITKIVYRPFAFSNVTLQKNIDVEYQICLGIGKG
jgi:hypothetical protein